MAKNKKLDVNGTEITILTNESEDYISLTDIARHKDAEHTVSHPELDEKP